MKKISSSASINQYINDYKQANAILDDLEQHQYEAELTLPERVKRLEISMIKDSMYAHDNNRTHAAKSLGISRELLIYKIKKYKI